MSQGWGYAWLNGTASLPPRCATCRRARCGTRSGYNRHWKAGEEACDPCKAAMAVSACRDSCSSCARPVNRTASSQTEILCQACRKTGRRKICPQCNHSFDPGRERGKTGDRVGGSKYNTYCSAECRQVAGYGPRMPAWKRCEQCGDLYDSAGRRSKRSFCTHECYSKALIKRGLPQHQVSIPLRLCMECSRLLTGMTGKRLTCSADCGYARSTRATCEAIKRRYQEDPDFRDRVISAGQNRRAKDLGLDQITSPKTLVAFLMKRDQGICGICEEDVVDTEGPMRPSIDHVIPLARGGLHQVENLQLAHYRCNLSKGARIPAETPGFFPGVR
jgi:hypothetical protein